MSKKKKNKKSFYEANFGSKKSKDSKKSKKNKGYYDEPKFKTVKPSLEKSESKENKKILLAPIEIPGKFTKNRNKCNHARDLISVEQFREMTPTHDAFTPMLDAAIAVFGEENVSICKDCYDVVVGPECVSLDKIKEAVATLYAAANIVVSHKRMKTDEIKDVAKVKNGLGDWNDIISLFAELDEEGRLVPTTNEAALGDSDVSKLNRVGGVFVQ